MVYEVDGDHGVFLDAPERFAGVLLAACTAVTDAAAARAGTGQPPGGSAGRPSGRVSVPDDGAA